jgi:hypothetical protein
LIFTRRSFLVVHTETFLVNPSGAPRAAERAEQKLVLRYRDYMAAKGIVVRRKRYLPEGEVRPIYCDAWVENRRALIEAKNSDGRDALRQAIGQLYDYRRFHEPPVHLAVLLPYKPGPPQGQQIKMAHTPCRRCGTPSEPPCWSRSRPGAGRRCFASRNPLAAGADADCDET